MKESHTKDKGDIGLGREELARGGSNSFLLFWNVLVRSDETNGKI